MNFSKRYGVLYREVIEPKVHLKNHVSKDKLDT